jgi:hypothetical protein
MQAAFLGLTEVREQASDLEMLGHSRAAASEGGSGAALLLRCSRAAACRTPRRAALPPTQLTSPTPAPSLTLQAACPP